MQIKRQIVTTRILDALLVVALLAAIGVSYRTWQKAAIVDPPGSVRMAATDWIDISTDPGMASESRSAKIVVVEFLDYRCAYCRQMESVIRALEGELPTSLKVVRRHFPLDRHRHSLEAAVAAECARSEGQLAVTHDALYANEELIERADWHQLAEVAGIHDVSRFLSCVREQSTLQRVLDDRAMGLRIGVVATPTLAIDGRLHTALTPMALRAYILGKSKRIRPK